MSRPRPRFVWVDSPLQALPHLSGLPTLDQMYGWIKNPPRRPPLASDLAAIASLLRAALSAGVSHVDPALSLVRKGKSRDPWPELPPLRALQAGVPLGIVLYQGVHGALHRSLAHGFRKPVLQALGDRPAPVRQTGDWLVPVLQALRDWPVPVCWYGQQDAAWIGYYDTLRRLGLATYRPDDLLHLEQWAALARSCGWWWPGEEVCVVVERPETVLTEPVSGGFHDEVSLRADGVRYRDGWHPLLA